MNQFKMVSEWDASGDQPQAIKTIADAFLAGEKRVALKGVTGSGKTFTMGKVIEQLGLPTLVISHNKTLSAQLYREFCNFFPDNAVEYFVSYYDYYQPEAYVPSKDLFIEKDSSINEEIERLRLSTTSSLIDRKDVIVIATVSCIYGLGSPENFRDMKISLRIGKTIKPATLAAQLVTLQYARNDAVLQRGTFRIRGDVIEIWPAYTKTAFRFELDWEDIKAIKEFDPLTGNVLDIPEFTVIYPAKHFVMPENEVRKALDNIRAEMEERYQFFLSKGKHLEAERIKSRTEYDLEMMSEMGYCSGIENYSRQLDGRTGERPAVLIDYFADDYLVIVDESHVSLPQIGAMYEGDRSRKTNLVDFGFRLPSALDNRPLYFSEFEKMMKKALFVSATPGKYEMEHATVVAEQIIRPTGLIDPEIVIRKTEGQIENLYSEILKRNELDERTLITTLTKKMSEDLTDYLLNLGLKVRYMHSEVETIERVEILRDLRLGKIDVLVGINLLREGLDLPEVSLVAILDADKIGFLRSATSLIQTIGRAARNVNGTVIMYADKISDAMKQAISETDRRRTIQVEYNEKHGITPTSIKKAIDNMLERKQKKQENDVSDMAGIMNNYNILNGKERRKMISDLEKLMLSYAKDLEFEKAAMVRDEIEAVKRMYEKGSTESEG